jgi:hypothetical protein
MRIKTREKMLMINEEKKALTEWLVMLMNRRANMTVRYNKHEKKNSLAETNEKK